MSQPHCAHLTSHRSTGGKLKEPDPTAHTAAFSGVPAEVFKPKRVDRTNAPQSRAISVLYQGLPLSILGAVPCS